MIKINVLRSLDEQKAHDAMLAAVALYHEERVKKSFSERHPELGKMKWCDVCESRHRTARVCIPVYAKYTEFFPCPLNNRGLADLEERVVCRSRRPSGRIIKHRNARGLQDLERARKIFNEDIRFYAADISQQLKDEIGKSSLSRALNELRKERKDNRRRHTVITKRSRKINRGR